ncbi:hypothetical protein V1511DRAFT_511432 [Dipodascopsis uninucleata]
MVIIPNTKWGLVFLSNVFVQSAIVLSLEGYVFGKFQANINVDSDEAQKSDSKTVAIPTYLALFIFAELYQLLLTWDAVRMRNTIQAIGLCMFNTAMLIYAAIQYEQIEAAVRALSNWLIDNSNDSYVLDASAWGDIKPFLIAVPAVIGCFGFIEGFVFIHLYYEFGWTIYKQIGADLQMRKRYLTYQIFLTLLKFDFFFFLGFTIQFVVIILSKKDSEFGLTIAVIPLTIVLLVLTAYMTQKENLMGMLVMIIVFFAGMAYFLFKLVRMYQPSQAYKYVAARKSLTIFAAITLFLIIATIVNAIICTINFNKGLKPYIDRKDERTSEEIELSLPSPTIKRRFSLD